MAYNVARGLLHMHLWGLVHCDVKRENILVFFMADDTMTSKLSGFGLTLGEITKPTGTTITCRWVRLHEGTDGFSADNTYPCGS